MTDSFRKLIDGEPGVLLLGALLPMPDGVRGRCYVAIHDAENDTCYSASSNTITPSVVTVKKTTLGAARVCLHRRGVPMDAGFLKIVLLAAAESMNGRH